MKLSVSYKQDTLLVMVHHIQNLSFTDPSRVSEMVLQGVKKMFTSLQIAKLSQAKPQLQLSWLALASLNFT